MKAETVMLVQSSWAEIGSASEQFGYAFYRNLFELAPGVRSLFREPVAAQAVKLSAMIDMAVHRLKRPDGLEAALMALGAGHVKFGVTPQHYEIVGQALIKTISDILADRMSVELEHAWRDVYKLISETMQAGARSYEVCDQRQRAG